MWKLTPQLEKDRKSMRKMVESMAPAALTSDELKKRYSDFMVFQNNLAHKIELMCENNDTPLSEICPRAYVVRRFVSNIGDHYTVQYCLDTNKKDSERRIEEAVSRDRILFYDYENVDQILADQFCEIMQQVPEPGEVFDPKYLKYYEKSIKIQNYPFGEDDNAPSMGFCGGCCGPHRKFIRYTMTEKKGGTPEPPLYLYCEADEDK